MSVEAASAAGASGRNDKRGKVNRPITFAIIALPLLTACAAVSSPDRLYPVETEMDNIRASLTETDNKKLTSIDDRNQIIAKRMYAIDVQYSKYEAALTHDSQLSDFAAKTANIALTTTGQLIPVTQTKNLLNGIGAAVNSLDDAYDAKILRARLIESIQNAMSAARHDQAAVIYANMECPLEKYPLAMAFSDLEAYYRAGTLTAGIIRLSKASAEDEKNAKANANNQKPANPNGAALLAANVAEAAVKYNTLMAVKEANQPCPQVQHPALSMATLLSMPTTVKGVVATGKPKAKQNKKQ